VGIQYRLFRRVKGGGELMGRSRLDGGNEEGGRRFGSATRAGRRAVDSGARRDGFGQGRRRLR
jgi:hypothetical protein